MTHTEDPRQFAAIALYWPGRDGASLMSVTRDEKRPRVVVFDNADQARGYLPLMAAGRSFVWADNDTIAFVLLSDKLWNRAIVVTDYDPYNPPNAIGVSAETKNLDWRNHIHIGECYKEIEEWAFQVQSEAISEEMASWVS